MPSLFVARRSSRHRTACFALYKALIQQALRVPLPDDVLKAPGLEGPVHPIKHLIRKSFRRNKNDTSPRLVISALRNGYKFLDMLTAAQDPSSPEHADIHSFLRERQTRKSHALSLRALHEPRPPNPTSAPNPSTIPLLTRVSQPGELPRYEPTVRPRPLHELGGTGVRRVPVLEKANFLPFLRVTKPQPAVVSRVIRQKIVRMTKVVTSLQEMLEGTQEAAEWEDQWERILERTGSPGRGEGRQRRGAAGPYLAGVRQDIYNLRGRLLRLRQDDHARGVALQKLVTEERALADKEKAERKERKRQERAALKAAGGNMGAGLSRQDIVDAIRGDLGGDKTV